MASVSATRSGVAMPLKNTAMASAEACSALTRRP